MWQILQPLLFKTFCRWWEFFSPGRLKCVEMFFLLSILSVCLSLTEEDEAQQYSRLHAVQRQKQIINQEKYSKVVAAGGNC